MTSLLNRTGERGDRHLIVRDGRALDPLVVQRAFDRDDLLRLRQRRRRDLLPQRGAVAVVAGVEMAGERGRRGLRGV